MKKKIAVAVSLLLVLALSIGGTIAWLTDKTDPVVNTFTVGDINITLAETKTNFKMVPGNTIEKDPKVTVKAGSEACWLFVKVEKSNNLDSYITYGIAQGWTQLSGVDGVYYREVPATTVDEAFAVLTNDQVMVKENVTKTMMNDLQKEDATQPTLTFTAYAVQKDNIATAADAWAKVSTTSNP